MCDAAIFPAVAARIDLEVEGDAEQADVRLACRDTSDFAPRGAAPGRLARSIYFIS